jgi:hypothetical protein
MAYDQLNKLKDASTRAREICSLVIELSDRVAAMQSALSEKVPGFSDAYQKRLEEGSKGTGRSIRQASLERLFRDFDELSAVFQELADAQKK